MKISKFVESSPLYAVFVLKTDLESGFRRAVAPERLGFLDAMVLAALFFEGDTGATPRELAQSLSVQKGRLSHCLARLEESKLVRRFLSESDRRSFLFRLTERGRDKSMKVIKFFDRSQRKIERSLGEKQAQRLASQISSLRKLASE